jgi:hypothetical protein
MKNVLINRRLQGAKMTKNQKNDRVGDSEAAALRATESGLRLGANQAGNIASVPPTLATRQSGTLSRAFALNGANTQEGSPATCAQILWSSFFFDGIGNKRGADIGLPKHSNIVRLFRGHKLTLEQLREKLPELTRRQLLPNRVKFINRAINVARQHGVDSVFKYSLFAAPSLSQCESFLDRSETARFLGEVKREDVRFAEKLEAFALDEQWRQA